MISSNTINFYTFMTQHANSRMVHAALIQTSSREHLVYLAATWTGLCAQVAEYVRGQLDNYEPDEVREISALRKVKALLDTGAVDDLGDAVELYFEWCSEKGNAWCEWCSERKCRWCEWIVHSVRFET